MNADQLRPWVGHLRPPRIVRVLPAQPETDDANPWVTGRCWLWCGRQSTRVLWIGTGIGTGGVTGHLFACAACIRALDDQILDAQLSKDIGGGDIPGFASVGTGHSASAHAPPSGRHRRRH